MCLHPCVSLNNENNSCEIGEDKIAVYEKTAGLRSGKSSDLDSACLKVLVPVKIFQISGMHYQNRFPDTFPGHNIRPKELHSDQTAPNPPLAMTQHLPKETDFRADLALVFSDFVIKITLDFLYHRTSRGLFCSYVKVMLSQCDALWIIAYDVAGMIMLVGSDCDSCILYKT